MTISDTKPHETYAGLRRQFFALQSLAFSLEEQVSRYRSLWSDQTQQFADLDGERETNALMTAALLAAEAEIDHLKTENEAMRKFLMDISRSSGDKWAVIAARNLMDEFSNE